MLSRGARLLAALPNGRAAVDGGALVFAGHRVAPLDPQGIPANEGLKITPAYLDFFVRRLRSSGYTFVSLDELAEQVHAGRMTRGLVSLTFDDGYRDNLETALPVLESLDTPFTVYALSKLEGRATFLWWFALEEFLRTRSSFRLSGNLETRCENRADKERAFLAIRGIVLQKAHKDTSAFLLELLPGFETALEAGEATNHLMNDSQLQLLGKSRLVTIGSHTVTHPNLASLPESEVRDELCGSKSRLEGILGTEVRHLAFPFGDRKEAGGREYRMASEASFVTAATMLAGSVDKGNAGSLFRLPRVPVREAADPADLIAENRARAWVSRARGLLAS